MKKIFLILFSLLFTGVFAQEINWISMNDALEAQKKTPKKIFMDVYTDWCGPCKMLDRDTFHNPDVVAYVNKNYYAVKFNAEGTDEITYQGNTFTNPNHKPGKRGRNSSHLFANALRLQAYPTMVFFDEKSNLIFPIQGYHTAQQLEVFLKLIATDDHKTVTSQKAFKEYEKNFKGTFRL